MKTNLQIQFLSFSRDVYHPGIISISPTRTSTLTQRSQHKNELPRLSIKTQLADWQTSQQVCRIGSYDEIVAHLERELELNALEESDDLPMATMTSSSTKTKTPLSTGQMSDITCNYCKEKGHMVRDCEKLNKKKEKDAPQDKPTQKKTYPECGTCDKTNHPDERCWQGAGAHLKLKRTRSEDSNDNKPNSKAQKRQNKPTSSSSQSSSSNDESKN